MQKAYCPAKIFLFNVGKKDKQKLHFCKQEAQTQCQALSFNGSNFVSSFRCSLDRYVGITDGRT